MSVVESSILFAALYHFWPRLDKLWKGVIVLAFCTDLAFFAAKHVFKKDLETKVIIEETIKGSP